MTTIPIDPHGPGDGGDVASMPRAELDKMRLWMTLIIGVLFIALVSIGAAVTLVLVGKSDLAAAAWPIATASVAGIVGLFAKSPTSN